MRKNIPHTAESTLGHAGEMQYNLLLDEEGEVVVAPWVKVAVLQKVLFGGGDGTRGSEGMRASQRHRAYSAVLIGSTSGELACRLRRVGSCWAFTSSSLALSQTLPIVINSILSNLVCRLRGLQTKYRISYLPILLILSSISRETLLETVSNNVRL